MRDLRPEAMDEPNLDAHDHKAALRSLERANRWLRTDQRLKARLPETGSVLDLACGGGGFLGLLAKERGRRMLIGLDRSARALGLAAGWQPAEVRFVAADADRLPFADKSIDTVTCSLFLHHLETARAIRLLQEAARVARVMLIVVDLRRSWMAWRLTWLVTHLVSRSWVFQVDGPQSVRAAFTADELKELAGRAGLGQAIIERTFPFRLVFTWKAASGADQCPRMT